MKKSKYTDFGKNAAPEKILAQYKKVLDNSGWAGSYSLRLSNLVDGAIEAFREGRPENIQMLIAHAKELDSYYYPDMTANILHALTEGSDDKTTIINLAIATVSQDRKTSLLSDALKTSIRESIGEESFFTALYKAGASFDMAISMMHAEPHELSDLASLKFFQEKISDTSSPVTKEATAAIPAIPAIPKISAEDADVRQLLTQLLEQVTELTQEVKRQGAQAAAAKASQPEAKSTPAKRSYPAVKAP